VDRYFVAHPPTEAPWTTLAAVAARQTADPRLPDVLAGSERLDALLAAGLADQLLIETEGRPELAFWRVGAFALLGRPRDAERIAGADPRARAMAASAWLEAGRPDAAVRAITSANPADPAIAVVRIQLALRAHDVAAAQAAAAAVDWDPAERSRRLADAALLEGDTGAGEAWLRAAAGAGSAIAWRELAAILGVRGDVAGANAAWREVLRLSPDDPDALLAIGEPEQALAADPCHVDALRAVAEARGCPGWQALWEVAPRDPALAGRRAACPELPSWPQEPP
jgi:tetratricopeptide (TPR) repeat protein